MMPASVLIRPAELSDLEVLAAIHATAFTPAWTVTELAWMLDPPGLGLVTEDAGQISSFLLARLVADEAEILTLAVRTDARHQGRATALLARLLEVLGERGVATVFLEVAEDNAAAIRLYESAGFRRTARRRGYYGRPEDAAVDALVMVKRMAGPQDIGTGEEPASP